MVFAALIKDLEAGKIVGEETGGLASSYSDVFSCRLPNSGLRLGISYKYFHRPEGLSGQLNKYIGQKKYEGLYVPRFVRLEFASKKGSS